MFDIIKKRSVNSSNVVQNPISQLVRELNERYETERRKLKEQEKKQNKGLEAEKSVEPALANKPKSGPSAAEASTDKKDKNKKQKLLDITKKAADEAVDWFESRKQDTEAWFNKRLDETRQKEVVPIDENGKALIPLKPIKNPTQRSIKNSIDDQIQKTYGKEIKQHEDIIASLNHQLEVLNEESSMSPGVMGVDKNFDKQLDIIKAIDDENDRWETSSAYAGILALKADIQKTVDPNKYTAVLFDDDFKKSNLYLNSVDLKNLAELIEKNTPTEIITNYGSPNFPMYRSNTENRYSGIQASNKVRADKKVDDLEEHAERIKKYMSFSKLPAKYSALPLFIKDSIKKTGTYSLLYDEDGNLNEKYNSDKYMVDADQVSSIAKQIGGVYRQLKKAVSVDTKSSPITVDELDGMIVKNQNLRDMYEDAIKSGRLNDQEKEYARASHNYINASTNALMQAREHINLNKTIKDSDFWTKQTAKNIGMGSALAVSDPDFLTLGFAGVHDLGRQLDLKDKLEKGERLSTSELDYLNSLAVENIFHNKYGDYENVTSFSAAKSAVQSSIYMLQFVAGSGYLNRLSGIGKGMAKSASEKFIKKYVRDFGQRTVKLKILQNVAKVPGMLAYGAGETIYAAGLANSLQIGNTWGDAYKEMLGDLDYSVNDDGSIDVKGYVGGKGWLLSWWESEARHITENLSESAIGHIFTAPLKGIIKATGLGKIAGKIADKMLNNNATSGLYRLLTGTNEFMKAGLFHGLFEEIGEEYAGNFYNHLLGVSEDTKYVTDEYGDKRQVKTSFWEEVDPTTEKGQKMFKDIAYSIALTSVVLGGSGIVSHGKAMYNYNKAKSLLIQELGKENAQKIEDTLLSVGSNIGAQDVMKRAYEHGIKNSKQKEAFINYFESLMMYQASSCALLDKIERADDEIFERAFEDAKLRGYSIDTAIEKEGLTNVRNSLRSIVAANINTTEEELDQLIEDNRLVEISRFYQENGDSETADLLLSLHLIETQYDAMQLRVQDDIDTEIGRNSRFVQRITAKDGKIRTAQLIPENEDESKRDIYVISELTKDKKLPEGKIMVMDQKTNDIFFVDSKRISTDKMKETDSNVVLHDWNLDTYRNRLAQNDLAPSKLQEGRSVSMTNGRVATIQGRTSDGRVMYSVNDGTSEIIRIADLGVTETDLIKQWQTDYVTEQRALAIENAKAIRLAPRRNKEATVVATTDVIKYLNNISAEQNKDLSQSHGRAIEFAEDKKLSKKEALSVLNNAKRSKNFSQFINSFIDNKTVPKAQYWKRLDRLYKAVQRKQIDDDLFLAIVSPESVNLTDNRKELLKNLTITDSGDVSFVRSAEDVAGYKITTSGAKQTFSEEDLRDADKETNEYNKSIIDNKPEEKPIEKPAPKKQINEKRAARKKANIERAERRREKARLRNLKKKGIAPTPKTMPSLTDVLLKVDKAINTTKQKAVDEANKLAEDTKKNLLRDQTTSHNYFVLVDGVRKMFTRARNILTPLFSDPVREKQILSKIDILTKVWVDTKDISKLKGLIVLQNTLNQNIDMYLSYLDENLDEQSVKDIIEGVANVIVGLKNSPSIEIQKIIYQLCLMFFSEQEMVYEDIVIDELVGAKELSKYMSQLTFNRILDQLLDLKDIYDALGWTIITEPVIFTTETFDKTTNSVQRIACEPGMIAVDALGNYHIVDFESSYLNFDTTVHQNGLLVNTFESIREWKGQKANMSLKDLFEQRLTTYALLAESSLNGQVSTIEMIPWHMKYDWANLHISSADNTSSVLSNDKSQEYDIRVPNRIQLMFDRGIVDRFTPYTEEDFNNAKKELDEFFLDPMHELVIDEYFLSGVSKEDHVLLSSQVALHNQQVIDLLNSLDKLTSVDDINQAIVQLNSLLLAKYNVESLIWKSIDRNTASIEELKIEYGDDYEEYLIQQLKNAFLIKYNLFLDVVSNVNIQKRAGNEVKFTDKLKAYYDQLVSDILDIIKRDADGSMLNLDSAIINKFNAYLNFVEEAIGPHEPKAPLTPVKGISVVQASNDWKTKNTVYKVKHGKFDGIDTSVSTKDPSVKLRDVINKPDFITKGRFTITQEPDGKSNQLLLHIEYNGHKFTPCVIHQAHGRKSIFSTIVQQIRHTTKNQVVQIASKFLNRTVGVIYADEQDGFKSLVDCGLVSTNDNQAGVDIHDIEFNSTQKTIGITYHTTRIEIVNGQTIQVPVTEVRVQMDEQSALDKYNEQSSLNKSSFTPDSPYALRFGNAIHTYSQTDSDRPVDGTFVFMLDLGHEEFNSKLTPVALRNPNLSSGDADFIVDALLGKYNGKVKIYDQDASLVPGMSIDRPYTISDGFGGNVVINGVEINTPILDIVDLLIPTVGGPQYNSMVDRHDISKSLPVYLDASNINNTGEVRLVGNVANKGTVDETFNLNTQDGINEFKKYITENIQRSININGFAQMRLSETGKRSNIFGYKLPLSSNGPMSILKYVELNGELKFGNSAIKFVADDFTGKGKGVTGMGWYLRNGFLTSNYNGVNDVLLGFEDNIVGSVVTESSNQSNVLNGNPMEQNNGTGSSLIEQLTNAVPNQQTAVLDLQSRLTQLLNNAMQNGLSNVNSDDIISGFTHLQFGAPSVPIDKEKAKAELERILGTNGFSIRFKNIPAYGWHVVGLCKAYSIMLSESAEAGTEYHEAFHRIVDLLFSEDERNLVHKLYKHSLLHRGRKNLTDLEVAEALADEFMNYMMQKPTAKYNSKILNFFRNAMYEVKALAKIRNYQLYKLYTEINSGKYANALPTQEQVDAFNKRVQSYGGLNDRLKGYAYQKGGHNFRYIANSLHYKKLINFMAMSFFHQSVQDVNWDGSNISELSLDKSILFTGVRDFNDLEDKSLGVPTIFAKYLDSPNTPETTKLALQELLDNYDLVQKDIAALVSQFATDAKEIKYKEYTSSKDGSNNTDVPSEEEMELAAAEGESWYGKTAYEFSPFDRASQRTKFFFSAIPKLKWADGKIVPVLNELGLPEMYSREYAYITIVNKCHDCLDIYEFIQKLAALSRIDPMYSVILDRFVGRVEDMNNGDDEALAMVTNIFTNIKSADHNFVLIKSNKLANGEFEMSVEDTSMRYSSTRYVQEWSMLFANGSCPFFKRNEDGSYSMSENNNAGIFGEIVKITNNYVQLIIHKEEDVTPSELVSYKDMLCHILQLCGIKINSEMINEYLESSELYKSADWNAFKLFIIDNERNIDAFLGKIGQLNLRGGLNIDNSGKVNGQFDITKYFNKDNFVKELGKAKYAWHRAHDQMSSLIAGNAKAYAKCENNQIDDRILELLKNKEQQKNLKSYIYNITSDGKGSMILKTLGKVKMRFNVHSGFKNHEIGNAGVDYSKISKREDYVAKATILLDGGLLIPTMSDKKTFGYIEGFRTILASLFNDRDYTKPLSEIAIPDEVLDQILEYVECEDKAVRQTLDSIKNGSITEHNKVSNFHGRKVEVDGVKHTVIQGARYCTMLGVWKDDTFVEFNKIKDENGYVDEETCYKIAHQEFFDKSQEEKRELMRNVLMHNLRKELKHLEELGLIKRNVSNSNVDEILTYSNVGLDATKLNSIYKSLVGNKESQLTNAQIDAYKSQAICIMVAEIMLRHIISMQEFDRCFAGNPAFFKWEYDKNGHLVNITKDMSKRLGGLISTGTNNCLDIPEIPKDYTCVEVDNEIIESPYVRQLTEKMYKSDIQTQYIRILSDQNNITYQSEDNPEHREIVRKVDEMTIEQIEEAVRKMDNGEQILDVVKATAKSKAELFNDVDVADGGAYVSAEMCKNMLKMVGSWSADIARAFRILQGEEINPKTGKPYTANDTREIASAYRLILTNVIGAQKYTAYGFRYQDGMAVPYYNKMALFPLFKNMCTGNMARLYEAITEQKIDMVMINSAVKVGSQNSAKIDWADQSTLDNLKDRSYVQSFANIRKQFNTDPKIHELMSMGTQMTKVVMATLLAGREYTVNGETLTAGQIRDGIMQAINNLSNIGKEKLVNKFLNADGSLNVEKFSDELTDMLASRGASLDMLDAISTREDKDGKKVLNTPIFALSEMEWILSIINSTINKEVIDINTPGEAFYQRSVWGMEGETVVLSDEDLSYSINNGEPLLMINEEGSMDCVLSVDYFHDILKQLGLENASFEKQKQGLIKHGVIGPNATANMIGYRIPTQAISSIHALRCVDVLPTVRDTVILPAEFTKITGSDFDIDKLFISMKYYHKVDGKITDRFEPSDSNAKYNVNMLIDYYLTILKDQRSLDLTYGPIDKDTKYLQDIVKDIESEVVLDAALPFDADMLYYQCSVRDEFINGKFGIGPFALNNNNHILTMLYNVRFRDINETSLLAELDHLRLDKQTDDYGESIMSQISGLINAHVDVAKDPYISRLNVNSYTYNLVNLLIRTGFGKKTFYFTTQPIVRMMAQAYINAGGTYMVEEGISKYKAQKNAVENTIIEYAAANGMVEKNIKNLLNRFKREIEYTDTVLHLTYRDFIKELFSPNCTVFNDIAKMGTMDQIQTKLNQTVSVLGQDLTIFLVQMLAAIAKFELEDLEQQLADLVKYSKIDTKKLGNDVVRQTIFLRGYRKVFTPIGDTNDTQNFINGKLMAQDSYIANKTSNATDLLKRILMSQIPSATNEFQALVDTILYDASKTDTVDDDTIETISSSISSILKAKYFFGKDGYCERFNIDPTTLVYGDNTIYDRLLKLLILLATDPKYQDQRDTNGNLSNYLLQTLVSASIDEKTGAKFVDTLSMTDDDIIDETEMRAGWTQLLECSQHPELQAFARDLVVYAFITSFDSGSHNLFKYVPDTWKSGGNTYSDKCYISYCLQLLQNASAAESTIPFTEEDEDLLFVINTDNDKLVPIVTEAYGNGRLRMLPIGKKGGSALIYAAITKHNNKGNISYSVEFPFRTTDSKRPPRFFKTPVSVGEDKTEYVIYKLTDYGRIGNVEFPIYSRVDTGLTKFKGGFRMYDPTAGRILSNLDLDEVRLKVFDQITKVDKLSIRNGMQDLDFVDYGEAIISLARQYMTNIDKFLGVESKQESTISQESTALGPETGVINKEESEINRLWSTDQSGTATEASFTNNIGISSTGYKKGDPQANSNVAYVFTENAQANAAALGLDDSWIEEGYPKGNQVKTGVSDVNGTNLAGIRASSSNTYGATNINPNAFGVIVKKYQQDSSGKFIAESGQFKDTDSDFELFKSLNTDMFDRLQNSGLNKIIFPSQMGKGKAALPLRFAEWLLNELQTRFGIVSEINKNTNSGYSGYGLDLKSVNSEKPADTNLESINIYAGTNENADLSNLAIRQFTIKGSIIGAANSNGNYTFDSVEHAFQAAKTMYSDAEDRQEWFDKIQKAETPAEARSLGKKIPQLDSEDWDRYSSEIMKDLIKASFEQNPQALQRLLATGNVTLTHTQEKGKWGREFPKLLMEVREELRELTPTLLQQNQKTVQLEFDFMSESSNSKEHENC